MGKLSPRIPRLNTINIMGTRTLGVHPSLSLEEKSWERWTNYGNHWSHFSIFHFTDLYNFHLQIFLYLIITNLSWAADGKRRFRLGSQKQKIKAIWWPLLLGGGSNPGYIYIWYNQILLKLLSTTPDGSAIMHFHTFEGGRGCIKLVVDGGIFNTKLAWCKLNFFHQQYEAPLAPKPSGAFWWLTIHVRSFCIQSIYCTWWINKQISKKHINKTYI